MFPGPGNAVAQYHYVGSTLHLLTCLVKANILLGRSREEMSMKRARLVLEILAGVVLLWLAFESVCVNESVYKARQAAEYRFRNHMADLGKATDSFEGPYLNTEHSGYLCFEWRSGNFAVDSFEVSIWIAPSPFRNDVVLWNGDLRLLPDSPKRLQLQRLWDSLRTSDSTGRN